MVLSPLHEGVSTMKTQMSRFHIHDDESAPPESLPIIKGALGASGQLPNFIGVLAGSPAALRAYARFRSELRRGTLPRKTLERISLAVAEHYGSVAGITLHQRTARQEGLGLDEVAAARAWDSADEREQSLLHLLRDSLAGASPLPAHLVEEAREHGWTDEQILEGIAFVALESFTAMVNVAGDVPVDGSIEESRTLRAA
jgi:alkylhydroperoxidase family enzyme